jgi:signal peptidase
MGATAVDKGKKTSAMKKVAANGIRIIMIALFALALFFAVQTIKHPDNPPSMMGYQPFTVLSNSMKPTFETGDLVIVKKLTGEKIAKDDVITFRDTGNRLITHRVVKVVNQNSTPAFVTKGDNNNVKDQQVVSSKAIVGKQVFRIVKGGYAAKFAGSPIGILLLVIAPLIGYICLEIYDRSKKSYQAKKNLSYENREEA